MWDKLELELNKVENLHCYEDYCHRRLVKSGMGLEDKCYSEQISAWAQICQKRPDQICEFLLIRGIKRLREEENPEKLGLKLLAQRYSQLCLEQKTREEEMRAKQQLERKKRQDMEEDNAGLQIIQSYLKNFRRHYIKKLKASVQPPPSPIKLNEIHAHLKVEIDDKLKGYRCLIHETEYLKIIPTFPEIRRLQQLPDLSPILIPFEVNDHFICQEDEEIMSLLGSELIKQLLTPESVKMLDPQTFALLFGYQQEEDLTVHRQLKIDSLSKSIYTIIEGSHQNLSNVLYVSKQVFQELKKDRYKMTQHIHVSDFTLEPVSTLGIEILYHVKQTTVDVDKLKPHIGSALEDLGTFSLGDILEITLDSVIYKCLIVKLLGSTNIPLSVATIPASVSDICFEAAIETKDKFISALKPYILKQLHTNESPYSDAVFERAVTENLHY